MASPRFGKYFRHLEEGLFNLGYTKAKAKLQSEDSDGNLIAWMDLTAATSAAGNLQVFVRMLPWEVAGLSWPQNMRTQLHAQGEYAEGPALIELVMENGPAAADADVEKFKSDVLHFFRGQHGAMTRLKLTDNTVNPGANLISSGALVTTASTWESEGTSTGILLPYGRTAAPGTLA